MRAEGLLCLSLVFLKVFFAVVCIRHAAACLAAYNLYYEMKADSDTVSVPSFPEYEHQLNTSFPYCAYSSVIPIIDVVAFLMLPVIFPNYYYLCTWLHINNPYLSLSLHLAQVHTYPSMEKLWASNSSLRLTLVTWLFFLYVLNWSRMSNYCNAVSRQFGPGRKLCI